jgi:DNA-binding FrmR family transcriptional regulator
MADDSAGQNAREEALVRLRRAHGQLGGVIHMMEDRRRSGEVLTQVAAVLHALHRAAFKLVVAELEYCRADPTADSTRTAELERLFVALG